MFQLPNYNCGGNFVKMNRIMLSVMVALGVAGNASAAVTMTPDQKTQTEQVVHDYLIKNPDVVVQSLQGYQEKQMEQARKTMEKTQETASKFADPLFHRNTDPAGGNPNG